MPPRGRYLCPPALLQKRPSENEQDTSQTPTAIARWFVLSHCFRQETPTRPLLRRPGFCGFATWTCLPVFYSPIPFGRHKLCSFGKPLIVLRLSQRFEDYECMYERRSCDFANQRHDRLTWRGVWIRHPSPASRVDGPVQLDSVIT